MNTLREILEGYYDTMGLPWGCRAVQVRRKFYPFPSPVMVRIRLDGYQVEFEHNPGFEIPPRQCWEKQ